MSVKKYIISLKDAEQRRSDLRMRLGSLFDGVKVIDAVDGRRMSAYEYFSYLKEARYFMTPSEMGCTLSHLLAYKDAISSVEKSIIILEDDAIIDVDGFMCCEEIAQKIPANGVCILGGQDGLKSQKWIIGKPAAELASNAYSIPKICLKQVWRTCAYVVGSEALKILIERQKNKLSKADDWDYLCGKDVQVFFAEIVKHPVELGASSIENERIKLYENNKNSFYGKFKKKILYVYERKFIYFRIVISFFYIVFGFVFVSKSRK